LTTTPLTGICVCYAGILPGRYTFNALLQAHSAAGDAQGAADVYDTMKDHGIKADHCTFIALFMVSISSHASMQLITACAVGLAFTPM